MSIRECILAPEGQVLVVVDLSQIECRMLNYLAGQEDVLEAFRNGRDLYCEAASRFYQRTITKADKNERQIFKSVELGCGYGMGAKKFKLYARNAGSPVDDAQADELIKFYRHTHENVCRYWREAEKMLQLMCDPYANFTWGPMKVTYQKITYPNGAYSIYHGLHRDENKEWHYTSRGRNIKIYGSLLVENVVQALSRIIMSQAMLKITKRFPIINTVHDEIWCLAPETEAENALVFMLETMKRVPDWAKGLPLNAEGFYAKNYSK